MDKFFKKHGEARKNLLDTGKLGKVQYKCKLHVKLSQGQPERGGYAVAHPFLHASSSCSASRKETFFVGEVFE